MKLLERMADARGTLEGKIIAVIMAVVLSFGFTDLSAFAVPAGPGGTNPTPGEHPYIVVTKTFVGLESDEIPYDTFGMTVKSKDGKNTYNLFLADDVRTGDLSFKWVIDGAPAGTYSVSESGADVEGYDLTTTGTGVEKSTSDQEELIDSWQLETTCSHVDWPIGDIDTYGYIFAFPTTGKVKAEYANKIIVIYSDDLTPGQMEAVSNLVVDKFPGAKPEQVRFVQMKNDGQVLDLGGKPGKPDAPLKVTYEVGAEYDQIIFSSTDVWTMSLNIKYEVKARVDGDFPVENKYEPNITIPVTKSWEDQGNFDGIRPASVTVKLFADNEDTGKTVELKESNQWSDSFKNLPKKTKEGAAITYTVKEVREGVITGTDGPDTYADTVTGTISGFTVTNTHTPKTVSIPVIKEWDDANNQDGIRPESVNVLLKADGDYVPGGITLSAANGWSDSWKDLPKYKIVDGKAVEIDYTVEEIKTPVITGTDGPGTYGIDITGNASDGFTVTNKHTPEKANLTVTKAWDDNDNQDGKRPESIEVTLSNGEKATLNASNGWTHTWSDLPVYANGEKIVYSISEPTVPTGYTATVDPEAGTTLENGKTATITVTNAYTPETTKISVRKIWEDGDDSDKIRPAEINAQLYADGVAVDNKSLALNATNSWSGTFDNLPKYKNGVEIKYTVEEVSVPNGYEKSIAGDAISGFEITNTHKISGTQSAKTGDDMPIGVAGVASLASLLALGLLRVLNPRRKEQSRK